MNTDNFFKLDTTLENLCGIALAISFWERPDVKEKIHENGLHKGKTFDINPNKSTTETVLVSRKQKSGQEIVNYVFELLDSLNLPDHLSDNIKALIVKIGQRISYWRDYVTNVLKVQVLYAEKIYWTPYGLIDELKIVQKFWLKDGNFSKQACQCFLSNYSNHIAAFYGQEFYFKIFSKSIKNQICFCLSSFYSKQEWTAYGLLAVWLMFCKKIKKPLAVGYFRDHKMSSTPDQISPLEHLWDSISDCNEFGTKYFWSRLKDGYGKKSLAVNAAEKCLDVKTHLNNRTCSFKKEVATRLIIFFVNEMSEIGKRDFMSKNFVKIFTLFFQTWPYQELCDKILYEMWNQVPDKQEALLKLVVENLATTTENSPDYFTEKSLIQKIFKRVMGNFAKEKKISFFTGNKYKILEDLFQIFDNDTLILIFNDADLKDHRSEMIKIGHKYIAEFLLKGDFKTVNKFIKKANISGDELNSLKGSINFLNVFLYKGDFRSLEEHLNWLFKSAEERYAAKNKIDAIEVCYIMLKNNKLESANKFLLWRFETEEERAAVKESLKTDKFLLKRIYDIWSIKNILYKADYCTKRCLKLLNWFYKSEDEITDFKKTAIISDEFFIEKYWKAVGNFEIFEEFLKFFSLTPVDIEITRIEIANKINWYIDNYAMETDNLDMVMELMDWVYKDDKEERRKVTKNYLNSPRGSLLCLKLFEKSAKTSPIYILRFFNSWFKPSFNFLEFTSHLENCDKGINKEKAKACIKSLLKLRMNRKYVITKNLTVYFKFPDKYTKKNYDTEDSYYVAKHGIDYEESYVIGKYEKLEAEKYESSDEYE